MIIDTMAQLLVLVTGIGVLSMIIGRKFNISYVPIFIIFGIIIGPVTFLVSRDVSREFFDYVRVFGLVVILFTEGHNLSWKLLKRNFATISILDTVGLVITALLAGAFFSWVFHAPFLIGFLFGAIISATDPATLIPLFRQHKVEQKIEITIVTESIFNDPLGIVLTAVAVAMIIPNASGGLFANLSTHFGIYGAAVVYFLYEVVSSIIIGAIVGLFGYWAIKKARIFDFPEIELFSLFLAFTAFFMGESIETSGYLAATVTGIVLGNYKVIGKWHRIQIMDEVMDAITREVEFNESLAAIATVFIFVLLGATLNLKLLGDNLIAGILIAFFIMLVARPIAALPILKWWNLKRYLFISLEGPRGVVPSALAAFPLSLALKYHSNILTPYWGDVILATTVITVLTTVIVETLWVPFLRERLLQPETVEDRILKQQRKKGKQIIS
ncbi:sodium:proton antiporter [Thermococcus sp. Bubb.Bath]|uniref:cation:proton antiporter n=1 Tax=Thermococcus sp. Bubb.Bath TaxID=1638242 RepID=UPI00143C65D1|nr:sodium:proton antiporter [Thermococcus sp. Bubb.Bath]NJF25431.1 sodium:proton antiporter [Thermococcus sp. Bubb.Bath]